MPHDKRKSRIILSKRLMRARGKRQFVLRLTSLIDVFMILLVFLIKNFSTRPEITLLSQNLNLPISTASKSPEISITIAATQSVILINGNMVDTIANIRQQEKLLNKKIYNELLQEKEKSLLRARQDLDIPFQGKAIIQADKRISYNIIKKILYTCGQAEFGDISLHVLRKEKEK